jgi:hypothetical protein
MESTSLDLRKYRSPNISNILTLKTPYIDRVLYFYPAPLKKGKTDGRTEQLEAPSYRLLTVMDEA